MRFLLFIFSLPFVLFIGSCDVVNPAEQTPTYVHVDSFQFIATPNTGTSSHNITHVSAYIDYAPVGTFALPATIPVLADKEATLLLLPAVQYSGLKDVIVNYFYSADTLLLTPAPGQTIFHEPKTHYWNDGLVFTHEDFESGNSFVALEGDTLRRTADPNYVFEGTYGGIAEVQDSSYSVSVMSNSFSAPAVSSNKAEAYLELNYKGTASFVIGLQTIDNGISQTQYLYGFNPRSDWNKVYVGLQDFLMAYPNLTYRVLVKVQKEDFSAGYVAFDNFKVVTRE